ncbi:hypothetical protein ACSBR2_035454 [Camellia fascicularis]
MAEGFGFYSAELQTLFSNSSDEIDYLSSEQEEVEVSETAIDSSNFYDPNTEGAPAFQREPLIRQNLGPANDSGATPTLENISIYRLPVGVKPSEELKNILSISNTVRLEKVTGDDMKAQTQITPRMSWDALTDAGFEVVSEFYDNASALLKGNDTDVSKKQGVLSVRAASMLVNNVSSQGLIDVQCSSYKAYKFPKALCFDCCTLLIACVSVEKFPKNRMLGEREFPVGAHVVGAFIMPCGSCFFCNKGQDDLCEDFFAYNRAKGTLYDGETRLFLRNSGMLISRQSSFSYSSYKCWPLLTCETQQG